MFRAAQAGPFDDAVVRATDENLTSENWEYILDVCDKVNTRDTGGKDAVSAMIKRLAHRNANVQLYTLELANALSQNCGMKIHKELASRSFTDALLRLANDRNTHTQVKAKILERMAEWSTMFARDPDLGIMEQGYSRLKSSNPSLHPPSKPFKKEMNATDRQKEDEELQMALALSIKDHGGSSVNEQVEQSNGSSAEPQTEGHPAGTTAATVSRVRALYDFQPSEAGELQFRKGDIIAVLESVYKDWWKGSLRGQTGIFPLNYVEKLQDPTANEMQQEAQMESEVFAEIRNVEKLLTLLSTSGGDISARDNEEITTLYHSTLAIRPKLIELIGKYSQKKDEFTQLNEKFIKARRDYESLLEAAMQAPQFQYPPHTALPHSALYSTYPPSNQHAQPQSGVYYPSGPPQAQQADARYPPPQGGQQPFYMLPPGQQSQQQQQAPVPENQAWTATPQPMPPVEIVPAQRVGRRAVQANHPHELPSSTYEYETSAPPAVQQYPQHSSYTQTAVEGRNDHAAQPAQRQSSYPPPQPTYAAPVDPNTAQTPWSPDAVGSAQHGHGRCGHPPGGGVTAVMGDTDVEGADASDYYR